MLRAIPVTTGPVMLGRENAGGAPLPDGKLSREHLELQFDGPGWTLRALGKNGTFINGNRVEGTVRAAPGAVVRIARTVMLLCDDLARFTAAKVTTDGVVIGPTLRLALDRIGEAAKDGAQTILITGETGAGKELAAATFHRAATPNGPLVPVNSATIQGTLAESHLFGTVKGQSYSGSKDAEGLLELADGGVLFLDEIADLAVEVQPKLLRAVETGEISRVNTTDKRKVRVRYVCASHKDLRQEVAGGRFRSDLFFRLAHDSVHLPALRERREEIPWLVAHAIAETKARLAHASLIEAALLYPWPGNVRELLSAMKKAANEAARAQSDVIREEHWTRPGAPAPATQVTVGSGPGRAPTNDPPAEQPGARQRAPRHPALDMTREQVIALLAQNGNNVTRAAKAVGLSKTQLDRLRKKCGLMGEEEKPEETAQAADDSDDAE